MEEYSDEDAYKIQDEGKRAIFIGIENGYPVGNDLSLIEKFYERGARYITLCHTSNNDICDSSTDSEGPEHNGLSDFGISVVKEMNRLGLMVDVSHISDSAFYDVIEISTAPVIASHSCARALCDNPRNLTDDMLRVLADNEGVIQMCFLSEYLKTPEPFPERDSARFALREKYKNFQNLSEAEMDSARNEWYAIDRKFPPKLATAIKLIPKKETEVEIIDQYKSDHVDDDTIVCRCERVSAETVRYWIRKGVTDFNELKGLTKVGMGACGGKTCIPIIMRIFREEGVAIDDVTENTIRPLFVEVPLGTLAGVKKEDK